jgi:Phage tail protein
MSMPPTPLQIDYIDPDGNDWDLSDLSMQNGYACAGIGGIEGLATSMQTIPLLDGTATPNIYIPQPGSIVLVILVGRPSSDRENDYYSLLDRVARAFYNRRNEAPAPGYIQVQRPDGSVRQIAVYTTSGLNTPEVGISNHTVYSFTLQTPDPYWQDLIPQQLVFSIGSAVGILPVLPVSLSGGAVIGNNNVINGGNAQAWPVWTITGPGTPTMKNLTTNRQWSLNTSIPSGHVIQVVTKPGSQMAVDTTSGTNIWDQLVLGATLSNLWSLMAGMNQISISMVGSSLATSVGLSWTNRWNRA